MAKFKDQITRSDKASPHTQSLIRNHIYDQTKIAAHFKGFEFASARKQDIKLVTDQYSSRVRITIQPDLKEGGTPLEMLDIKDSLFANILKKLSRDSRAVILFKVHPNSFNTYLKARNMTDDARIAAGWEIQPIIKYTLILEDVEVKPLATRPPADPSKPKPKGPPKIGPKLD
jgi:hypothetical protein